MVAVLRGLARLERQGRAARQAAASLPTVQIGPWKFAVRHNSGRGPTVEIARASDRPHRGSEPVAESNHSVTVGLVLDIALEELVTRYPGYSQPDLRKLVQHLAGWFIHPAAFLACQGSRKAQATAPPLANTPQNTVELADLLCRVLYPQGDPDAC